MAIRALSLDLFDTLVDLPMDALPRVAIGGREIPTTVGRLHEVFAAQRPIGLEDFARALRDVDRAWREAYWEQGRELPTLERFARLAEHLGADDPDLPARLTGVHMDLIASLARAPAHHAGVLDRLRARFRLGLCSNFSHAPAALAVLEDAGLRARLDAVVISHDVGVRKPRVEIFAAVLDALGAGPHEVVHVGDNLDADVAGAAALGMRTAWITRRVREPEAALERYAGPAPTWTIRDLAELESLAG